MLERHSELEIKNLDQSLQESSFNGIGDHIFSPVDPHVFPKFGFSRKKISASCRHNGQTNFVAIDVEFRDGRSAWIASVQAEKTFIVTKRCEYGGWRGKKHLFPLEGSFDRNSKLAHAALSN